MATVVLVGAGATLAESLAQRPSKRLRPPLDATFFQLCESAKLEGGETVRAYMEEHFGIDPFSHGYTMESVFNFIYSDVFSSPRPRGSLDAYSALIRMYSEAIAETTNGLKGTSRAGIGALLRVLWANDKDLSFITFNQDLVIEKALEGASETATYSSIPWNILTCYDQATFEGGFLYPTTGAMFRTRWDSDRDELAASLPIYKLHGSLNWAWRVETLDDTRNSIPKPGAEIHCLTSQHVEGDLELDEESEMKYLLPLVVPPIYEKGPQYRGFLAQVWNAARRKLAETNRLIVFGYSFPIADFSARSLLRASFHLNDALEEIVVIDVNPSVASGLADLLDLASCSFFRDVPSFKKAYSRHN